MEGVFPFEYGKPSWSDCRCRRHRQDHYHEDHGGISRTLLPLEDQGGELFFGEPDLDIMNWMRCDENGRGMAWKNMMER